MSGLPEKPELKQFDDDFENGCNTGERMMHDKFTTYLSKQDKRLPTVEDIAFIIFRIGMRNLASEGEIKHEFRMHDTVWNPTVNESYVKAQAIHNLLLLQEPK